jgi:hypothetical protein
MIAKTTEVADRARRRVAFRLLPYLALLYIIAFLDRSNISTAALQMPHDFRRLFFATSHLINASGG